jgi:hypothetical protein
VPGQVLAAPASARDGDIGSDGAGSDDAGSGAAIGSLGAGSAPASGVNASISVGVNEPSVSVHDATCNSSAAGSAQHRALGERDITILETAGGCAMVQLVHKLTTTLGPSPPECYPNRTRSRSPR